MIDVFTTYGTQHFWSLKYRIELSNIFVVDPLFTLPMLITVVWLMFRAKKSPIRKRLSSAGLILSGLYLVFTLGNKVIITHTFSAALEKQKIKYERMITGPAPFNQLLWAAVIETPDSYLTGYYSHPDSNKDIRFQAVPKNHILPGHFTKDAQVKKILRFTNGYYTVEPL